MLLVPLDIKKVICGQHLFPDCTFVQVRDFKHDNEIELTMPIQ